MPFLGSVSSSEGFEQLVKMKTQRSRVLLDFFVLVFFYFCENENRHASQERIFQEDHLQEHLNRDEGRETSETSSRNRSLRGKGSQEGSEKTQDVMKYLTIDRIFLLALSAAMGFIYQSQQMTNECQDRAIEEFTHNSNATLEALQYEVEWLSKSVNTLSDTTMIQLPSKN